MRKRIIVLGAAGLLAMRSPARADWFIAPFVGVNGGGDSGDASAASGVSAGWMGGGWLGAEAEVAYSPSLFQQTGFLTDHRLSTVMGNAIIGLPIMRSEHFHPFVGGGIGWMKPRLTEAGGLLALDKSKFGMNIGAGATGFFNRNVGLRGDVRYFKGLHEDDEDASFNLDFSSFHYWRTSAGLVVRF